MARLTNSDVNRMSLGQALQAQSLTDWDQAHIASHKRMREAGLGQTRVKTGDAMKSGGIMAPPPQNVLKDEPKPQGSATPSDSGSSATDSKIAQLVRPVNQKLSAAMAPFGVIIDAAIKSPPYYPQFKDDFKRIPVDALVGLFKPLDNFFLDVVNNANDASQVKAGGTRRIGLPGRQVDVVMGLDVPANLDPYAKDYTKRLKVINNVLILAYQDPAALAKGIVKTVIDNVKAGKTQAKEAVDNLVEMVKIASSSGVNISALSGVNEGIVVPDDRFFKALAQEIKNQLPNLPTGMFSILDQFRNASEAAARAAREAAERAAREAQAAADAAARNAAEVSEVARFFANYLYLLVRHIGIAFPGNTVTIPGIASYSFPFNYWAAAARINKDGGDTPDIGVMWEIRQFRGQNSGQDDGRVELSRGTPFNTLRSMQWKGASQNWSGPVYNRVLEQYLQNVNSDLDRIQNVASDMAGRKRSGASLFQTKMDQSIVARVFASYPSNPMYPPPTTLMSDPTGPFATYVSRAINDSIGKSSVVEKIRQALSEAVNALGSQMPFPMPSASVLSNLRIPAGLSGYKSMYGIPMDTYQFRGLGEPITMSTIAAAGAVSTFYGGGTVANGGTAAGGTGVATAPATTPELTGLIGNILSMYTGGGMSAGGAAGGAPKPPTITAQPQSVTVEEGGKATFSVTAASAAGGMSIPGMSAGPAPLSYQWSKDGVPIAGATSSSLMVDATLKDSGSRYTVTVGTGGAPAATGGAPTAGSVVSQPATLTVTAKKAADGGSSGGGGGGGGGNDKKDSNVATLAIAGGALAALALALSKKK